MHHVTIGCLLATLCCVVSAQEVDPPPTVDEFDVVKYVGRWYQVSTAGAGIGPISSGNIFLQLFAFVPTLSTERLTSHHFYSLFRHMQTFW